MQKEFDNENRSRYYGLRVGDIVDVYSLNGTVWGRTKVIGYHESDNNRIYIKNAKGKKIDWVAEWCEIIKKVEDGEGISE